MSEEHESHTDHGEGDSHAHGHHSGPLVVLFIIVGLLLGGILR